MFMQSVTQDDSQNSNLISDISMLPQLVKNVVDYPVIAYTNEFTVNIRDASIW